MPVVKMRHAELNRLAGKDLTHEQVEELAFGLAAEVEGIDGEEIALKFEPIRPDLFSVEGFARASRGLLGLHAGLWKYAVAPPRWVLRIDPSVAGIRPVMVAARLTNVDLTDDTVRSVIDLQEKLDASIGRGRRRVSIGLHDPRSLHPPLEYKAVPIDSHPFVPLGHTAPMTPLDILQNHEKGRQYGHIISGTPVGGTRVVPLLVDSRGQVLSLPPIINGELTKVSSATKELFLDVTGLDLESCTRVLNILCCAIADRGAAIEAVSISGEGATNHGATPDLSGESWELPFAQVQRVLGAPATPEEAAAALRKVGHDAKSLGPIIEVHSPAYRADLLHLVDLVEDVAIGLGYGTIPTSLPSQSLFAHRLVAVQQEDVIAASLVGQGFTEISTLLVTNQGSVSLAGVGSSRAPAGATSIKNPITTDHTHLRASLLPDLINSFRINRHREMPQRVFEIGFVVAGRSELRRVAMAAMHPKASFTECKSHVEAVLRDLKRELKVESCNEPGFIPGRCAAVTFGGKSCGVFGEVHPAVLERSELAAPVIASELDIDLLFG